MTCSVTSETFAFPVNNEMSKSSICFSLTLGHCSGAQNILRVVISEAARESQSCIMQNQKYYLTHSLKLLVKCEYMCELKTELCIYVLAHSCQSVHQCVFAFHSRFNCTFICCSPSSSLDPGEKSSAVNVKMKLQVLWMFVYVMFTCESEKKQGKWLIFGKRRQCTSHSDRSEAVALTSTTTILAQRKEETMEESGCRGSLSAAYKEKQSHTVCGEQGQRRVVENTMTMGAWGGGEWYTLVWKPLRSMSKTHPEIAQYF